MIPAPTQSNVTAQLRKFLLDVLPAGAEVVLAQPNRVPEVKAPNFCVMTPLRITRLRTNVDAYADSRFTGSIAGTTMTVTGFSPDLDGAIDVGVAVFGAGVASGTKVTARGTGIGGVGTYSVTPSQTVASRTLSAGRRTVEQGAQIAVQMDFHSDPKADVSGDMAVTASTLLRDAYAVEHFANQVPAYGVVPLYASDPAQRPFTNDQQQVENRWVVEALLQANVVLSVPQQFADSVDLALLDVEAVFPP